MNKSLLIFFAVIAAASALRLPVGLKGVLSKIENVHQKDAEFESAAMADVIPEETYENDAMADAIPEGTYESDAMADAIPEGTYESAAMAEDTPKSADLVQKVVEKIESLRSQPEEFESEHMADIVPEVAQEEEQAYESLHMADAEYESKAMADEPYESADMKDDSAESDEIRADGGDIAFARRFAADGAHAIVSAIAEEAIAELRRFAADGGVEMERRFHADGEVKTRDSPILKFLPRLEVN